MSTSKFARRSGALKNVAVKRSSVAAVVNLNALVRVFFLDGSSKVLQMFENSIAQDVLIALKFNLDLKDISTYALFRVCGNSIRRVEVSEVVTETLRDPTESGQEVRLLFRTWVNYTYGVYDHEVFQYGIRNKQANTALWLAFMEATFMVMTERFYLTEDESIALGCLKMQAEAGDFNPSIHTVESMKQRVINRFPQPVRNKMKALSSNTLSGSHLGQELAARIQLFYARMSGKSKVEAQISYLDYLRTYCPFYGSHYYEIQCQYDENPNDTTHSPPVINMLVSIGPNGIHLITPTDQPVIMRHSYKRILKWLSHPDQHIFTYYVLKRHVTFSDLEEMQEEYGSKDDSQEISIQNFCDCVYLVTNQVREIEYLVKTYIQMLTDEAPQLPNVSIPELLPPKNNFLQLFESDHPKSTESPENPAQQPQKPKDGPTDANSDEESSKQAAKKNTNTKKKSRLSIFFHSIGSAGVDDEDDDDKNEGINHFLTQNSQQLGGNDVYGDDTAAVGNSLFKNMYSTFQKPKKNTDVNSKITEEQAIAAAIPPSVQYAASMSELKRLAEETGFSDNDEGGNDEESSDDDSSDGGKDNSESSGSGESEDDREINNKKVPGMPSVQAFRRASKILFGSFGSSSSTAAATTTTTTSTTAASSSQKKRAPPPPPKPEDSDGSNDDDDDSSSEPDDDDEEDED